MKPLIAILFLFAMMLGTASGWLKTATGKVVCVADGEGIDGKENLEDKKDVKEVLPQPAFSTTLPIYKTKWHLKANPFYTAPLLYKPTPPPDFAC